MQLSLDVIRIYVRRARAAVTLRSSHMPSLSKPFLTPFRHDAFVCLASHKTGRYHIPIPPKVITENLHWSLGLNDQTTGVSEFVNGLLRAHIKDQISRQTDMQRSKKLSWCMIIMFGTCSQHNFRLNVRRIALTKKANGKQRAELLDLARV